MSKEYRQLWAELNGPRGWNMAKDDIKELVTDPLLWATNLIEFATQNRKDSPGVIGANDGAWQRVEVALDVLKWFTEEEE